MDAWNRRDFAAFQAAFHPEAEFHSSIRSRPGGSELTWRGLPTMRRLWGEWVGRGYGAARASAIVRPSGGAPGSRRAWTGVRAEPFFGDNPPARLAGMHS